MSLRPRSNRRSPSARDGRFSLCHTRVARTDRHPSRRPSPRYAAIVTGATLIATLLATLAIWPRESITMPGVFFAGADAQPQLVARFTLDDFAARQR